MSRDLFNVVVPENQLHKNFSYIASSPAHSCSRRTLQRAFELLPKPDGNFIKDFQSTGFDARVWELYLIQFLIDAGLNVSQPFDRPDYLVSRPGEPEVWIEATTANPTQGVELPLTGDHWEGQDKAAIKLGSALWSKLNKRYWELPHVKGKPLVLAIEDFHDPDPMRMSSQGLGRYLFGVHTQLTSTPGEVVDYDLHPIGVHRVGSKAVPSGFFNIPEAENISAVLFSNAGTVAKFNRMGYQEQPDPSVRMLRFGLAYDPNPRAMMATPFYYLVGEIPEGWGDEAVLFHNPRALRPISDDFFGTVAQEKFLDGELSTWTSGFHVYSSVTQTMRDVTPEMARTAESSLIEAGEKWVSAVLAQQPEMERLVIQQYSNWSKTRS